MVSVHSDELCYITVFNDNHHDIWMVLQIMSCYYDGLFLLINLLPNIHEYKYLTRFSKTYKHKKHLTLAS